MTASKESARCTSGGASDISEINLKPSQQRTPEYILRGTQGRRYTVSIEIESASRSDHAAAKKICAERPLTSRSGCNNKDATAVVLMYLVHGCDDSIGSDFGLFIVTVPALVTAEIVPYCRALGFSVVVVARLLPVEFYHQHHSSITCSDTLLIAISKTLR